MTRDQLHLFASNADRLNLNNPNLKPLLEERLSISGNINELMEKYILKCIGIIDSLHSENIELGMKDNKAVSTLIAIIICCGIAPSLEPKLQTLLLERYKYPTSLKTNIFHTCLNYLTYWIKNGRNPSYIVEIILQKHFSEILLILIHNDHLVRFQLDNLQSSDHILEANSVHGDSNYSLILQKLQDYFDFDSEIRMVEIINPDHITFLHFEKIANILQSPKSVDLPTYFDVICKQLLEILNSPTEIKAGGASDSVLISIRCSAFVIVNFINKRPKMAKSLLLTPILQALLRFSSFDGENNPDNELAELDLDGNRIVTTNLQLHECLRDLENLLVGNEPIVHPLLAIYQYSKNTLQNQVFQILSIVLKLLETSKAVAILIQVTKNSVENTTLGISNSSDAGIQFVVSDEKFTIDPVVLANLLEKLEKPELVGYFFIQVLETRLVFINNHLENAEELSVYFSSVIVALLDTFEDRLLKNTEQILKFVKATLLDSDEDEKHMGLTLLSQIFTNKDDLESMNEIKIILSTLCDGNDEVAMLARSVQLQLLSFSKTVKQESKSEEIFREALKELGDELLPIRAHGMNQIRYLVLQKDPVSIQHLDSIISIFIDFLQDTDSFIYLNAIKGCSALADVYPEKTLNKLTAIYKDTHYTDDVRSRMGESILQIIQRSGEIYPKYADLISPSVMVVLRHESNFMKASAIILCSHIAKQCPRSLLPFISQLFDYILGTMQFEKDLDLKKGILVLATNLIRNLNNLLVHRVGIDPVLKLKILLENHILHEKDLISKGHAEMCLDDLNNLI
ncbi:transmembrane and coiled-coil domains-containing protein 7 [Boothiomyces sp. JEL0866]|nr:transmembrane and coiled-coil domains-containing protein 7 [Boothiomyces sp. JEL0866]